MTNEQVAHIMALVDEYEKACDNSTIGKHGTRAQAARAAVEAALLAPQAEGWVMVPVELNDAMRLAYNHADEEIEDGIGWSPDHQWKAMLAARPSAPTAVEPPYPMATTLEGAAQDVAKWLNERPECPLDLRNVAMLVHAVQASATAVEPTPEQSSVVEPRDERAEYVPCPTCGANTASDNPNQWCPCAPRASKGTI